MLIDESFVYKDLVFYGTPWVPIISYRWAFEAEHDVLTTKFQNIPTGIDILLSHTPPYIPGAFVDVSLEYGKNSQHFGSAELTQAILDKQPRYSLFGHIHSGDHSQIMLDNTACYNVSYVDESYQRSYAPLILEI